MRLWRFLAPLPTMAIGMAVAKYGLWYGSTDHGGDGTCEGLEGLGYCGVGLAIVVASMLIPLSPRLLQCQTGKGGPGTRERFPARTFHPSQDPIGLFD
jgi:hypothetical protein